MGQSLSLLVPEGQGELFDARREQLLAGSHLPPFEGSGVARDGTVVPLLVHLLLVRDEHGAPVGTLSLSRDLRPAMRIQARLSASEAELRARFRDSAVPQARTSLDGTILAVNPALAGLLGWSEAELLDRNGVELYAEPDQPAVLEALARLLSGEVTQLSQEHRLVRADGTALCTITTASVIEDASGQPCLAISVEDVDALRATERAAREQSQRLEVVLEAMPVVVFSYDVDSRCTWVRGQGLARAGVAERDLLDHRLLELYADSPQVCAGIRASLAGREGKAVFELPDSTWKCYYRPLLAADGTVLGGVGVSMDVTQVAAAEREVRASEARLRALLRNAADVVMVLDGEGRITYVSPALRPHLGFEEAEVMGQVAVAYDHPDDRAMLQSAWERALREPGVPQVLHLRCRHADGSWRWTQQTLINLLDDPDVSGVVVNVRDVSQQRRAQLELQRLALHDSRTGLPNRALLLDRADQALTRVRRRGEQVGLVLLDVVGLQCINEAHGHEGGDWVLRTAAERLLEAARDIDTTASLAGGSFAVLVEEVASTEELRARAATLAGAVTGPVDLPEGVVDLQVRVGLALGPADDSNALLTAAERAMPASAGAAGAPAAAVVARAAEPSGPPLAAAEALRRAVGRGELRLHYQPVVRLRDGAVEGVEALVRWQHPERGLLAPSEFVPLAESSGVVVELGEWVLREACQRAALWQARGQRCTVGVNLSPRQMIGGRFVDLVREVLATTGAAPEQLVLEVTESAVMDDPGATQVLHDLRGLGVSLALDDFGTGYSSLTYLKRFPVDAIKIDRSFVAGLGRDADDEAIVASVVSLARSVGKVVVAEGVETAAQLAVLRGLGVDLAQGYLWSLPLPADALDVWRVGWRPAAVVEGLPAAPRRAADPAPVVADGSDDERIMELHGEGASLHTIAAALNAEGRRTPAGPRWTTKTVARVVAARAQAL